VLLHDGNKFPSIPLAYAVHTKVTYTNIQVVQQINPLAPELFF